MKQNYMLALVTGMEEEEDWGQGDQQSLSQPGEEFWRK